jgi:hypothetical protein
MTVSERSWDDRFADLLERIMATAATGGDPKPLQEEYARMLKEVPASKKKTLGLKAPEKKNARPKS